MENIRTKTFSELHASLVELYNRCDVADVKAELAESVALLQEVIELEKVSAACEPRAKGGSAVG